MKTKTRVAIVLPAFYIGGAETMVSRLASHLDLNQVEAEVICIYGKPLHNHLEKAILDHGVPIKFIGKGKGFSLKAIFKLWKEFKAFKPSVIHTHIGACIYCAPWVLCHHIKMLHTIHNEPQFELIKPKRLVMNLMYKLHKAIPVAISKEIQNMMVDYYRLPAKTELVYNPVDVAKFHKKKVVHKGINIITVGRLTAQKNQKLLIDTVKEIVKIYPEVSLKILGDGDLRKKLTEYVKQQHLSDHICFMGNVNNVADYFAEADIFVLSSAYEGLPLVVLVAMAAGLPIVSTDVGGIKDVVTDNGILVEPGNKQKLIKAVESLIENKDLGMSLGKKSYQNVQPFDSKNIAKQYTELYVKYSC